ncbi:MAG TPA: GntR family transcriptional regulator [Alphaproteobacteria bacterium]|nr:GntR family transcriptional regulator [Alphaproteobacteria bacterium]
MTSQLLIADGIPVPAEFRPVPDVIYEWLRTHILSGRLAPGMELRQDLLAKHFSVSRVPVREALSRLQAEGLIVLRPRRGFAVVSLNRSEIIEIFELRMVVEEHALAVATRARTAEDIARIEATLTRMERLDRSAPNYLNDWAAVNHEFHTSLINSARRQRLSEVSLNLRDAIEPYIRIEANLTGQVDDADSEHRAIFNAFRDGDADEAGRVSRAHCESTMRRLLANVDMGADGTVQFPTLEDAAGERLRRAGRAESGSKADLV